MTDHHDTGSQLSGHVAAEHSAIPGDRRPSLCRVPAARDGNLSPELAQLILDTHTSVGDVVLDIDDDVAFAAAAARAGRRHHALGGVAHLATIGHAAGYIDMILLHWPRPAVNPRWLFLSCRALLRSAGCLVVAVSVEPQHRVSHLRALSGAASTAGLHLVDHIAAVDPDADTATLVAAPQHGNRRERVEDHRALAAGLPVPHTDLPVFRPEAGAR